MSHTEGLLGSGVHDAAQRAADIIDVLVPRPGSRDEIARRAEPRPLDERERLIAVLRAHGEPGIIEISDADLAALRQAALDVRAVFAAADVATAWAIAKGTTPIIGVTKAGYIDGLVRARGIELAEEEIAELEALADAAGVDTRGWWEQEM